MAEQTSKKPAPQVTVSDKVQRRNQMRKAVESPKKKDSNSGSGGLTENQRLALYMALAGAAGSGVGAAVGGRNNRLAGALIGGLGAAAVTGLSKPITDLISESIKTVNPPPKHQFEGTGWTLAKTAPLFAAPIWLQSLKPSYNNLAAIARNWTPDKFKNDSLAKKIFGVAVNEHGEFVNDAGKPLTRVNTGGKLQFLDPATNAKVNVTGGLKHRIEDLASRSLHGRAKGSFARSKELSRLLNEAQAYGLLRSKSNPNSLGLVRNWLSRARNRRLVVGATGLAALGTTGYAIYRKIADNRERMKNGW